MLRLLTRLVLLFALGFFAPGEAAARVVTRAESPDVSAEKLASWGSAPEIAVLRQAAAMQAAEMQQGSASHSYEVASIYSLAAESRLTTVLGSGRDVAKFAGKEGFNVLDMAKVPEAEWARTNAEWLNTALRRGDNIWLVTDPAKHTLLMNELKLQSYYLDLELPMLDQFGAKAIPKFAPTPGVP